MKKLILTIIIFTTVVNGLLYFQLRPKNDSVIQKEIISEDEELIVESLEAIPTNKNEITPADIDDLHRTSSDRFKDLDTVKHQGRRYIPVFRHAPLPSSSRSTFSIVTFEIEHDPVSKKTKSMNEWTYDDYMNHPDFFLIPIDVLNTEPE